MDKKRLFFDHIENDQFLLYAYYLVFDDLPENLSHEEIVQAIEDRLVELPPEEFIENAYLLIFLRDVDEDGRAHYTKALRNSHPLEILDTLSRSKEAKSKPGLKFYLSWKDRLRFKLLPRALKRVKHSSSSRKDEEPCIKPFIQIASQIESLRRHPKLLMPELPSYYSRSSAHLRDAKRETERLFGREAKDFYTLFESVFYNSDAVRFHQRHYLSYLHGSKVLDIGAGRGEFVELLLAHGYEAIGIDSDENVVRYASSKGLPIHHADALEFLHGSDSFDTIIALEVVEHLQNDYLWSLLHAIFDKLTSGGRVILETPNPLANTGIGNFYMDPTHIRPLPPQLLSFMMEFVGFCDLQILFSSPVPVEYATSFMDKNYQTYAIIGTKS